MKQTTPHPPPIHPPQPSHPSQTPPPPFANYIQLLANRSLTQLPLQILIVLYLLSNTDCNVLPYICMHKTQHEFHFRIKLNMLQYSSKSLEGGRNLYGFPLKTCPGETRKKMQGKCISWLFFMFFIYLYTFFIRECVTRSSTSIFFLIQSK